MIDAGRIAEKLPRFGGERSLGLGGGAFLAGAGLIGVWASHSPDGPLRIICLLQRWVVQLHVSSSSFDACPVGTGYLRDGLACGVHGPWVMNVPGPGGGVPPATRPCALERGCWFGWADMAVATRAARRIAMMTRTSLMFGSTVGSDCFLLLLSVVMLTLMAAAATVLWFVVAVRFSFSAFQPLAALYPPCSGEHTGL